MTALRDAAHEVAHEVAHDVAHEVAHDVAHSDATERRILAATIACLARFGLGKTTLDDVAREAGCARATVYRYFPGKAALIDAAVAAELERAVDDVNRAGRSAASLEDAVVAMMITAARELEANDALQVVLAHEPELVLPHLSFEGGSRLLADASEAFAPILAAFLPAARAERAAEWCTRVLLAHYSTDGARVSLTDPAAVRPLVSRYVLPGLVSVARPTRTDTPQRR